ncbi:HD domain-containing phosphohydrolase [Butyrivibrio sp. MC2021]|uniref:HD domain-containing phosphohydrolase n=1 Tax=Butyrivibrio sp. MC2021 TaxID=1408306 RepID=UPI000479F230|nr:HD domain-containing phosphohydrolase [Butyrivibrio sp. MC2021]
MSSQILIVDDDPLILKGAWNILTEAGMKAAVLKSGLMIQDYIRDNGAPDLILLDISMPDMDGFEVLKELRKTEEKGKEIPIIFLTANEDEDTESKGLSLGAMDYIRKPFIPSILVLRVRHVIELVTLQRELGSEVERKTREIEQLYLNVVSSLADAIDAKDAYTNGHSARVAEYSREIAKRYGFDEEQQDMIYMMGLLHDVGKIGVPDEIINKPSRLTDEEFAIIKSHPVIGGRILSNIKGMPMLVNGARWHHERYDGRGYPDGKAGEDIPLEARMIAVADAYDAMSSNRSYRGALPQEKIREEIEKGKGTQFDPQFADIMLAMIDEDTDYNMRDKHE